MKIVYCPQKMQKIALKLKRQGKKIGFVPTMGALHQGHLALIKKARKTAQIVVVSIFVNPLQFGPHEDFKQYPRNFEKDCELLKKEKVDYVFFPSIRNMYPEGFLTEVEVKNLGEILCGHFRPGHFKGVTTVVLKLFNIVQPDFAFFGEKDFQQLVIVKKMVEDLNLPVQIIPIKTQREKSGLALSSRNLYLKPSQKRTANILYQALLKAQELIKKGERSCPKIEMAMRKLIEKTGAKIEYIAIVDPKTLANVRTINRKVRILLAVWVAGVRLIDNISITP